MKRFLPILILGWIVITSAGPVGGKITTRSEKLSDFHTKMTKVVLTGNLFQDTALKEAVRNSWTVSPYEFCTGEEFKAICNDDSYYFLVRTTDSRKKGISFLTLVKGGEDDIKDMIHVFSMPVGAENASGGTEEVFLTALVSIMQEYVEKGLQLPAVRLSTVPGARSRLSKMKLFFSDGDLDSSVDDSFKATRFGRDMYVTDAPGAEDIIMSGAYDTAVSYVIAPENPAKGDLCYKLMLDARTFDLLYFEKHRIGQARGRGFLKKDIKTLSRGR